MRLLSQKQATEDLNVDLKDCFDLVVMSVQVMPENNYACIWRCISDQKQPTCSTGIMDSGQLCVSALEDLAGSRMHHDF